MISVPGLVSPFTREQLEQINSQVTKLLRTVGMRVTNAKLRQLLEDEGLEIDKTHERVKFPMDLIKEVTKSIQEDNEREESYKVMPTKGSSGFLFGGCAAPFLYSWRTGKITRPKKEDLVKMIRIGGAIEEAGTIGTPVIMSEIDPRIERIKALALLIENTTKPVTIDYYHANQLKYIVELLDIIGQDFCTGGGFIISPLILGERVAACLVEESKYRIPNACIGAQPVAGVTAPVTIVGVVTLGTAEILGGWIIAKTINRKVKVRGNITSGIMDMSTGKVCFCTPETIIQDAGVNQLCEEIYGVPRIISASSVWIDAKVPGIQAALEKSFKQLALGCTISSSFHYGLLDGGRFFCPTQMIIDYEINKMFESTFRDIRVDDEMMPVSEIKRIMDTGSSFLESEHTLKHFRQSILTPKLWDRTVWCDNNSEANADKRLLEKAEKIWQEALETYKPPQREGRCVNTIEHIVHQAEEDLLKI